MRVISTLTVTALLFTAQSALAVTTLTDLDARGATADGTSTVVEYPAHTNGVGDGFGAILGTGNKLGVQADVFGNLTWSLFTDPANPSGGCDNNNHVVIYIDSIAGGFNSTVPLTDESDSHREAISGIGADLTFAAGFEADYAIAFNAGFAGLWKIEANQAHTFVRNLTPNVIAGCQRELGASTLADLGLKPGDAFDYVATLINPSTNFRSNEFHGVTTPPNTNIGSAPYTIADGDYITFNSLAVVINEVDADTPDTDVLEFVEILTSPNADLSALSIVYFNGSNDQSYFSDALGTADANGYFVVGNAGVSPDLTHPNGILQNGQDAVALYLAAPFADATTATATNLVDLAVYDTNDADDAGLLALFPTPQPQVNESANGASAIDSSQRCAGDALNTTYFFQDTATPRAANLCPVCTTDADCGSCQACDLTVGLCQVVPDNTVCDDGDLCTVTDVCAAGVCGGAAKDCSADSSLCATGTCNATSGACEAIPVADGTICSDGDLCTVDICTAGICNSSALDCSAQDSSCAEGTCNPATGVCAPTPINEGGACDDGSLCTVTDICTAGTCGGTTLDCSTLDGACTAGSCNATTGACEAIAANEGGACDDGSLCTVTDICTAGTCGGTTLDCSTLDGACSTGTCNATTGACEAVAANEGGACNDGNLCTTTDVCIDGACNGSSLDCSNLDSACSVGSCNATTGACEAIAANEGQTCDDGDLCTTIDICAAGVCGGAPKSCTNLDSACQVGTCDATTGDCVAQNLENGSACDDASACSENDACTDGVCAGTAVAAGTACGDQCNAGVCDGATGTCAQVPLADGTGCDDSDPCTVTDVCNAGSCEGAPAEDGTACDDGDECTDGDSCVAGICAAGNDICMMADVGPDAGEDAGVPDMGIPDMGAPDMGEDVGPGTNNTPGDDTGTDDAGDTDQPVGPITSGTLEGSGCSNSGAPLSDVGLLLGLLGLLTLRRRRA